MSLPLLPGEHIADAFEQLVSALPPNVDERLRELCAYVENTWVTSRQWPPQSWSSFQSSIRTNNDCEGWHNRLNNQSRRGKLDVYQLVPVLYRDAEFVSLQAVLVSERRLCRYQRKTYTRIQGRLNSLWELYTEKKLTTSELLKKCAYIYGPSD